MKKLKKIFGLTAVLFFMFLLIPKTTLATDGNYKIWGSKNDVDTNKQWTITFNYKLNPSTINNQNIKVTDESNNSVNTVVTAYDGKTVKVDAPKGGYTPGKTYTLKMENISSGENKKLSEPIKMPFTIKKAVELSQTINNVTVKIRKVEQDTDSLRVYVTYINNSDKAALTGDSLTKIVYANRQYEYDSDFNFNRFYEKDITAPNFIEPTVSADSVIFFKPIADVENINIVLSANFESYRFNNVAVSDMAKGQIEAIEEEPDIVLSSLTQNNITININKVVQDDDSLNVYVTYINNDTKSVLTGDSLTKVIANGKQYEYDSEFNFNRFYNQNVPNAQNSIEPTVHEKSVIYFSPIKDIDSINLVLSAGFKDYRFNNVKVERK